MGNSSSARRRTQSGAIASPASRTAVVPIAKPEKFRPRSASHSLIDEKSYAPRKQIESDFPENSECPICFLNYEELNIALCCKQLICTECYLLMKNTAIQEASKCPCPFCSNETLNVVYNPNKIVKKKICPNFQTDNGHYTEAISSSFSSNSTCSKTDGYETASSNGADSSVGRNMSPTAQMNVPLSSVNDRRDIEIAIQQQRNRFSDDQPPLVPSSARTGLNTFLAERSHFTNEWFDRDRGTSQSTSNEMRINDLLISECLANHAMGRTNINDLERIEEMMMMEAIRQSMASSPGSSTAAIATSSLPAANERESSSALRGGGSTSTGASVSASASESSHKGSPPPYPTWAPQFHPETVKSSRGASAAGNIHSNESATWNTSEGSDSFSAGMESSSVLSGYFSDAESDVAGAGVAWDEGSRSGKSLRSEEVYELSSVTAACAGVGQTMKEVPTAGVKSESIIGSPQKRIGSEELSNLRVPHRVRSPGNILRPLAGRFPESPFHVSQSSAVGEILEKRDKGGICEGTGASAGAYEAIDIAAGRIPPRMGGGALGGLDQRNNLQEEKCGNETLYKRFVEESYHRSIEGNTDVISSNSNEQKEDSSEGQDDIIFTDVEEVTDVSDVMDVDVLQIVDQKNLDRNDGASGGRESEEEEVIMLSVVLNEPISPLYDAKYDTGVDAQDLPIYL